MSAIGPALPPHLLAKRKRQQEEEAENESTTSSGAKRASTADDTEKRRRVMGPVMPPAPLDERPAAPANKDNDEEASSDDSDDDFGPALPTTDEPATATKDQNGDDHQDVDASPMTPSSGKLQRDDWMMIPPKQDDLAARLDPSKPRPKGFNTSKGARSGGTADGDNSVWHETPEQKRKRLENEMMGVAVGPSESAGGKFKPSKNAASRSKGQEKQAKARGPSLLEQHQKREGTEVEDDPSKRAFDREKDMASGMRISSSQRKSLLNRASDFESRFSRGSSG